MQNQSNGSVLLFWAPPFLTRWTNEVGSPQNLASYPHLSRPFKGLLNPQPNEGIALQALSLGEGDCFVCAKFTEVDVLGMLHETNDITAGVQKSSISGWVCYFQNYCSSLSSHAHAANPQPHTHTTHNTRHTTHNTPTPHTHAHTLHKMPFKKVAVNAKIIVEKLISGMCISPLEVTRKLTPFCKIDASSEIFSDFLQQMKEEHFHGKTLVPQIMSFFV